MYIFRIRIRAHATNTLIFSKLCAVRKQTLRHHETILFITGYGHFMFDYFQFFYLRFYLIIIFSLLFFMFIYIIRVYFMKYAK